MLMNIRDLDGGVLDARVELDSGSVVLHSRGGAFGKPNLRNPDYRKALRVILARLLDAGTPISGVWLDSSVAQTWPEQERLLLRPDEFAHPVEPIVTLIGQRGASKGRPLGSAGHGNSTKRIRIGVPDISAVSLQGLLKAVPREGGSRLSAAIQRQVQPHMIDEAIEAYLAGAEHNFHGSRDYDLLLPSGERLPPKAIFGIALAKVIERPATPSDFSAGWGQPCFDVIESAGYPIVPKDEHVPSTPDGADDERTWAEGSQKRVQHLRRERAPGLAKMKKRRFVEEHGHLFCERCHVIPSKALGPLGDACIEVHHSKTAIAKMGENARTRLADLQCLCANCHRIVHREQL